MGKNIGFISFRLAGTDGVSLETKKWAHIFEDMGHKCFFSAGELDTPEAVSYLSPLMHFKQTEIKKIHDEIYNNSKRPESLTKEIHKYRELLKKELYAFIKKFDLDLLVPQNALTIPLNVPLGLAITEVLAETGLKAIAHHHDFFWERKRFLRNCVWDYLNSAYPPHLPNISHVVINTSGQNQLALRTGVSSTLIPNVMDFEKPAPGIDDYSKDVRQSLGVADDELLILQPTRVVKRKGIEHAIEFVARLGMKATLVISHASGDEGYEYEARIHEYAELLGIKAIFVDEQIGDQRGTLPDGKKIYSLFDVYPHVDFVTYPSVFEGFGNAFLEAIYFRKPILVNNYSIYSHDIKPKGFDVIEIDDFISSTTIKEAKKLINSPERIKQMVEKNYKIAMQYYSYGLLKVWLNDILESIWGYHK